jgi:acyl transferase domain-containing protein
VAYTLQAGREAMDHRVAMTVSSMSELAAKLTDFIEGKTAIEGLCRGEVKRNDETLALFRGDEELRDAVGKWMQRGKWSKILEVWVKGLEIEWEQLYGEDKPRRVSLPTYPFAKEHCWIDAPARSAKRLGAAAVDVLHLAAPEYLRSQRERSTSTFTGEEFFLTDHQILNGPVTQKTAAGSCVSRNGSRGASRRRRIMNRASSSCATRSGSSPWSSRSRCKSPSPVVATKDHIDYEIYSGDAEQETVHRQGKVVFSRRPRPARLELDELRRRMARWLDASELYTTFERMGLHYGPTHRGITAIHIENNNSSQTSPAGQRGSEPARLRACTQRHGQCPASFLGLFIDLNDAPNKPSVPFDALAPHPVSFHQEMTAWVRHRKTRSPKTRPSRWIWTYAMRREMSASRFAARVARSRC